MDLSKRARKRWRHLLCLTLSAMAYGWNEGALGAMSPEQMEVGLLSKQCSSLSEARMRKDGDAVCKKALAAAERVLGSTHDVLAIVLHSLSMVYVAQGRYEEAEPLLERALKIHEIAPNTYISDLAQLFMLRENMNEVQHDLAVLYYLRGKYELAERLFLRVLKRCTSDHFALYCISGASHDLGLLYLTQGKYDAAEPLFQRALAYYEDRFGPMDKRVSTYIISLGSLYLARGQYEAAEPLFQRALKIREIALGPMNPDIAVPLVNLAALYHQQGLYEEAESLLQRALKIQEAALGLVHPALATVLRNLAEADKEQGQYEEAESLLQRALKIQEAALGLVHPSLALTLGSLGELYSLQRKYTAAELRLRRALKIEETAFGSTHSSTAITLAKLAWLYVERRNYETAEPLFQRALKILEAGPHSNAIDPILLGLATLYLVTERPVLSVSFFSRALMAQENQLRQTVSEPRVAALLQKKPGVDIFYSALLALPKDPGAAHLALSAALLRKGRTAEEGTNSHRAILQSIYDPQQKEQYQALLALRAQHEALIWSGPGKYKDYEQRLQQLRQQADELEHELSQRSSNLRRLQLPPPEQMLAAVARALPGDGALIEVVQVRPYDFPAGGVPGDGGSQRYLAMVLLGDSSTQVVDLGETRALDQAALRLLQELRRSAGKPQPVAEELYRRLFAPLLPLLSGKKRLYLSLDGQLNLIPFSALHNGQDYLLASYQFTYLTSGRDLVQQPLSQAGQDLVVLANPDYQAREQSAFPSSAAVPTQLRGLYAQLGQIPPLPGTADEARQLLSLLPGARLLQGKQASEGAVRSLRSPRLLHIATHGVFLDGAASVSDASRSGAPGGARLERRLSALSVTEGMTAPAEVDNPLSRSALLLAGAAQAARAKDHTQDGLLTGQEAATLELGGTELVVLSACDTGRGGVQTGQGVYGLRRAFMVAGAQTLVTSLWQVADDETGELMVQYYKNLKAGQGRVAAMHEAARFISKQEGKANPYYWAPFIVLGSDAPLHLPMLR